MTLTLADWQSLWIRLGAQGDPQPSFEALKTHYSAPERAYHTLNHVEFCLRQLEPITAELSAPDSVRFAIWTHDVIYDSRAQDNEAKSAHWASEVLTQAGVAEAVIETVAALILATRHQTPPPIPDSAWVMDVDVAILGQPAPLFQHYESQIRQEYAWVPPERYQQGRRAVLESFLKRPQIYYTAHFRQRLETQARQNLRWSLGRLGG